MNKYYYLDGEYSNRSITIMAIIKLIYHVILISFAVVILIVSIVAYSEHVAPHHSIRDFTSNWKMKPIVDIQVNMTACPEGYENLVSREWPGTAQGCHCPSSFGLQEVFSNECTHEQTKAGCKNVYPVSHIEMKKVYKHFICGKREGRSFVNSTRPNENNQCHKGHETCFNGDPNNAICVKNLKECPITDIQFIEPGGEVPTGYQYHEIGNNYKVAFSKKYDSLPIVKLRLTEGLICADYKQFSTSQGRELYKLIKKSNYGNCTKKVGGEYTDPRVSRIGSVDERTLFNDNEIIKVVENLPEYPISQTDKYSWNVYDNSFYPWSLKCDEKVLDSGSKFDRHYLYYVTHTVSEAQSIHLKEKDKVILAIIYLFICGAVLGGLNTFLTIKEMCSSEFRDNNKNLLFGVYIATIIISWGFYTALIIVYAISISSIEDYREAFSVMEKEECSDSMTNNIMRSYDSSLLKLKDTNITGLIFTILSMTISFVYIGTNLIIVAYKIYKSK